MKAASNIPQPVNQELLLPTAFPPMPRVMVDRFGTDAQEYEESLQTFWTRTRRVLADMYFQVTAPVNKVVEKTKDLSANIQHIETVIVTDDEIAAIVIDIVAAGAAAIEIERIARETADGYLEGSYTLRVIAGSVVTGMKITSASGPGTEISEIIFQTNILKVQTATGPVITMMDIRATGIVFGTDLASDNYVANTSGWQLKRNTGQLNAMAGVIGGFTIAANKLYAGSGADYVEMNPDPDIGFLIGTMSPGPYGQLYKPGAAFPRLVFARADGVQVGFFGLDPVNTAALVITNGPGGVAPLSSILTPGRLDFNSDTNLYRSAANVLKTDDAMEALTFNSTSSIRFKENIRPIDGALALVGRLQGCRFDWKDEHALDDIGLIAEEVHEIFPTIVGRDNESRIASLDYSKLTAVLVEAVKELAQRVNGLEHQSSRG